MHAPNIAQVRRHEPARPDPNRTSEPSARDGGASAVSGHSSSTIAIRTVAASGAPPHNSHPRSGREPVERPTGHAGRDTQPVGELLDRDVQGVQVPVEHEVDDAAVTGAQSMPELLARRARAGCRPTARGRPGRERPLRASRSRGHNRSPSARSSSELCESAVRRAPPARPRGAPSTSARDGVATGRVPGPSRRLHRSVSCSVRGSPVLVLMGSGTEAMASALRDLDSGQLDGLAHVARGKLGDPGGSLDSVQRIRLEHRDPPPRRREVDACACTRRASCPRSAGGWRPPGPRADRGALRRSSPAPAAPRRSVGALPHRVSCPIGGQSSPASRPRSPEGRARAYLSGCE